MAADAQPVAPATGAEPPVEATLGPPAPIAAISRAEWRWALWASAAVMALTCLPYLFGWLITPPGYHYMGLLSNPDEHNVYLGWMRQAQQGHWLFRDPFTTEPQRAGFFHAFFWLLGWKAGVGHAPLILVYHGARVISGLLLLVAVYALAAQMFAEVFTRRLAWGFAAFSSGFGWLYALARPAAAVNPIDFGPGLIMPEAITFLSLLMTPLFCFSVLLMVALWWAYLAAVRTGSWGRAALAGLAGFVLGNVHTYDVFSIWLGLGLYLIALAVINRRLPVREGLMALLVVVMSAPFVAYQYWLFQANPVFRDKALTPTLTPPFAYFALGFGLVIVLAAAGATLALQRRDRAQVAPVAWAVATLLLVVLWRVSFQRKMAEGVHLPLCLLAASFVGQWLAPRMPRRRALIVALGLLIVTIPSNAFFVARTLGDLTTNNRNYLNVLMPPLYLPTDTVQAMEWLRAHSRPADAVLCMPLAGSYLPGVAGNTVFIGHWAETLNYQRKLATVRWFFSERATPAARRAFMQDAGLRYVLYTPDEAAIGRFNPAQSGDFEAVFARPRAVLFRLASAP